MSTPLVNFITNPVQVTVIIGVLGFFIKKWMGTLEKKMDVVSEKIDKKCEKDDLIRCQRIRENHCEKIEKNISEILSCVNQKATEDDFLRHSHTEQGKIILN